MYGTAERLKTIPAVLISVIGAIPGILIWTLVGAFGEVLSIVSVLIPLGIYGVYSAVGEYIGAAIKSKVGLVGCFLVCPPAVIAGVHCHCAAAVYFALKNTENALPFKECLFRMRELLGPAGQETRFLASIAMGMAFFLISYLKFVKPEKYS